jgi:hypothetical protein
MAKITIVLEDTIDDASVGKDGYFYSHLDLSSCGVPENFWALQWDGSAGHIEYNSPMIQNNEITTLPSWANACLAKWDEAKAEEEVEAARIAAEEAAAAEAAAAGGE